jgi:hypothetical protein
MPIEPTLCVLKSLGYDRETIAISLELQNF